jgi:DNA-binding CsgD family transcriptional regulator
MTRITFADSGTPWADVHGFLLDMGTCRTPVHFSTRLLPALRSLVRHDSGVAAWLGETGDLAHVSVTGLPAAQVRADMHLYIETVRPGRYSQVFCNSLSAPSKRGREVEISDLLLASFSRYGVQHLAGFSMVDANRPLVCVVLCRHDKKDPFTERDLAVFSITRTHLANLYANLLAGDGHASRVADAALAVRELAASTDVVDATGAADVYDLGQLTRREREIAFLMCQGASTELIASSLSISPLTVKKHISNILRKMGVASRHELATILLRRLLSAM